MTAILEAISHIHRAAAYYRYWRGSLNNDGVIHMTMFNRLFTREFSGKTSDALEIESARELVQHYESFLEAFAPLPDCVADITALPYSKPQIKQAIALCLGTTDDYRKIENLKHGYLMLASWQHNVGSEPVGLDFTQLDLTRDPLEVSELIHEKGALIERWKPLMEAEHQALLKELQALGV